MSATNRIRDRLLVAQHPGRDVLRAGEHDAGRERPAARRWQQRAERLAARGAPRRRAGSSRRVETRRARPRRARAGARRRATSMPGPDDERRRRSPSRGSRGARRAAEGVAQLRPARTEQQDRERQHDDARREQPRALVVAATSSAGSAMYGTWNRLNAVAAQHEREEHPDARARPVRVPAGTAKVSDEEHGQQRSRPAIMKRRRDPVRARLRSLRAPMTGSMITSQTFATVTSMPGDERGDAERVGEEEDENEAGQGGETAGAERSDGVGGDGPVRSSRSGERRSGVGSDMSAAYRRDIDSTHVRIDRSPSAHVSSLIARPHRDLGRRPSPVIAPFTGEVLHDLPLSTAQDVADAAAAARVAQAAWRAAGFAHRRACCCKAHDLLLERRERAARHPADRDRQDPRPGLRGGLQLGATSPATTPSSAQRVLRAAAAAGGIPVVVHARVQLQAQGRRRRHHAVELPARARLMDIIPALAAGNAVVQKADNQGALTILASRRAFIDAGVPAALWAVVAGDGDEIGNAVVDAADYVCFTGSTATGRTVGERAAARLDRRIARTRRQEPAHRARRRRPGEGRRQRRLRVLLVDGPAVRLDRAHLRAAGRRRSRSPPPSSRACSALVDRDRRSTTRRMSARSPPRPSSSACRRTSTTPSRRARRCSPAARPAPTSARSSSSRPCFRDVTPDMKCFANETFGPVVAIHVVDTEDGGDRRRQRYGVRAQRLGVHRLACPRAPRRRAVDAGSVNINEGYRATFGSVDAPMGGMKKSGLGRRNGHEGLLRFVERRTIAEATGLLQLPRTGAEFARLAAVMLLVLKALKAIRRR